MVILGIDPGLRVTGFGIIKQDSTQKGILLNHGYVAFSGDKPIQTRILHFYTFFTEQILLHGVTNISFETPFLGKNSQNFLKLGYLRAIIYLLAEQHGLALHEFTPRQVKQTITGFGGAEKDQVSRVILQLFPRLGEQKKHDVTDALAVMLCGLWHNKTISSVR